MLSHFRVIKTERKTKAIGRAQVKHDYPEKQKQTERKQNKRNERKKGDREERDKWVAITFVDACARVILKYLNFRPKKMFLTTFDAWQPDRMNWTIEHLNNCLAKFNLKWHSIDGKRCAPSNFMNKIYISPRFESLRHITLQRTMVITQQQLHNKKS